MKDKTRDAIAELDTEAQQELVAYLATLLSATDFVEAVGEDEYDDVQKAFLKDYDDGADEKNVELLISADDLHAAICEGRKQDAIDILNAAVPEAKLRRVETQNYLFPDRVVS